MPLDEMDSPPAADAGRRLVIAGVVGACALGVGAGLWARPSAPERGAAPAAEAEALSPHRKLQIVLADPNTPAEDPLEVLPARAAATGKPAFAEFREVPGPALRPAGLMKVDVPTGPEAALTPALASAAIPESEPEPEPKPEVAAAPPPKPVKAKAETPTKTARPKPAKAVTETPKPKSKTTVAEAKPKPKPKTEPKAETRLAKAAKPQTKTAKAEKPKAKASDLARSKTAGKAQRPKPKETKLARSEPKAGKSQAREKPRLEKLAKAAKAAPKTLKPETAKAAKPARVAKAETKPAKSAKAPSKGQAKAADSPSGAGPLRVAKTDPCVSRDPGEALVCADPRLSARERQLQRAYAQAEAAGVSAAALRRQQQRWLAARAAAAREAPWAVEDVYVARIAELNDLARDARSY